MIAKKARDVYQALRTILVGMRITLKYNFARTVTVQYPDVPPTLQPRFRGFHWYQIERCTACKACQRACPVDCIYVEHNGVRKLDKETGTAKGGAMKRYAIDYSKCMFCSLCVEACAFECLGMSDIHDMSVYDRKSTTVEFTELARNGVRVPQPLWMQKARLPEWAQRIKQKWIDEGAPHRDAMRASLEDQPISKPPPAAAPAAAATAAAAPPAVKPIETKSE